MSVILAIGAFLAANGPTILSAGGSLYSLWTAYGHLAGTAAQKGTDISLADMNTFMDSIKGLHDDVDAAIAAAHAEIVAAQTGKPA